MTVDAVITWVDGNDPVLNAKRAQYGTAKDFAHNDVAGATRFANVGEIFWCVASINRFAPWIRKIFIVTDGQDPKLEPFLQRNFPEGYIPVEIVDHKTIFRGYEQYLPVFNSISIETMIWRIPGLSEHFIYFNDDVMLLEPTSPEDFFTKKGIVSRASWRSIFVTKLRRFFNPNYDPNRWTAVLAAEILGQKKQFLKLFHTPRGLLRSWYISYFSNHQDVLLRNIGYRFRDKNHFSIMELQYLGLYNEGRNEVKPLGNYAFYIYPKSKPNYVVNRMKLTEQHNYKCCCINSLDLATEEDKSLILSWLERKININASSINTVAE